MSSSLLKGNDIIEKTTYWFYGKLKVYFKIWCCETLNQQLLVFCNEECLLSSECYNWLVKGSNKINNKLNLADGKAKCSLRKTLNTDIEDLVNVFQYTEFAGLRWIDNQSNSVGVLLSICVLVMAFVNHLLNRTLDASHLHWNLVDNFQPMHVDFTNSWHTLNEFRKIKHLHIANECERGQ